MRKPIGRAAFRRGGNPPKHTQFRKGTSDNPRGRPKGSKNLSSYILQAARDKVSATLNGKTRKISKLQATTMQLATKAASGDHVAIGKLLDWVDEVETRAASRMPTDFPIGEPDIEVIRCVFERMKQCESNQQEQGHDALSS